MFRQTGFLFIRNRARNPYERKIYFFGRHLTNGVSNKSILYCHTLRKEHFVKMFIYKNYDERLPKKHFIMNDH